MSRLAQWRARGLLSTDNLLVLANLGSRGFGFLVSLVLARTAGIGMLGAYSSLQISSSAPTTPLSLPLANSATLMAAEHTASQGLHAVAAAHRRLLLPLGLLVVGGSCGLVALANDAEGSPIGLGLSLGMVALLAVAQLLTQFAVGLYHGAQRGLDCALAIGSTMALGIVLCLPVVWWFGVTGALWLATFTAAGPGLWLLIRLRPAPDANRSVEAEAALRCEAVARLRQAAPSVVSTVIRNGTSWFCCIYLTQVHHGHVGVGLITIGLQWIMLMQLPISSWGGRIVSDLGDAGLNSTAKFEQHLWKWARKCVLVTAALSALIALCFPGLALLYKADPWLLTGLMAINALASTLAASTYVYERAAFCLHKQRAWLWLSGGADAVQIVFTLLLAPYSLFFIVTGPIISTLLLILGARWFVLPSAAGRRSDLS